MSDTDTVQYIARRTLLDFLSDCPEAGDALVWGWYHETFPLLDLLVRQMGLEVKTDEDDSYDEEEDE